ncbi:MAG: VanZ family protein [Kiritimatiellae bacterium]|nr:VanZ family protein [Kiritimatiellia bacterium]
MTSPRKTKVWLGYWFPPAAWAAGLFTLSSITFPPGPPAIPFLDKLVHGGLFAVLSILLYRALRGERGWPARRAALWAFALTVLYGATDELHQWFTPERCMDARDWVADVLGAAVVFLVLFGTRSGSPEARPPERRS